VVVTPMVLIWSMDRAPRWNRQRVGEALLVLALVIGSGLIVFGGILPAPFDRYPYAFLCFPGLALAAFRFRQRGAASAAIGLTAIALWGTLHGFGPFALREPNEALQLVQAFIGVVTVTSLVLGAVVSERDRVEESLRGSREALARQFLELDNL